MHWHTPELIRDPRGRKRGLDLEVLRSTCALKAESGPVRAVPFRPRPKFTPAAGGMCPRGTTHARSLPKGRLRRKKLKARRISGRAIATTARWLRSCSPRKQRATRARVKSSLGTDLITEDVSIFLFPVPCSGLGALSDLYPASGGWGPDSAPLLHMHGSRTSRGLIIVDST
jgi:hypothetical protein